MLLTIPVGTDALFAPYHRVYGTQRLPRLFEGFQVRQEEYWIKDRSNRWVPSDKVTATNTKGSERYYALGLFVLM
jgi:hypothetical protein